MTADLIFGITADNTRARQGINQTEQSLDALRRGVQQVNQQGDTARRTFQTFGREGAQAARTAGTSVDRLRSDLKSMASTIDAVNDNFRQTGTRSKGELAVAESAVNSLRRAFRRAQSDIDRLETVSGSTARGVVKDATLMQRAVAAIGTAATAAQSRLAGIGAGLAGAAGAARRGVGFLGIGAGVGLAGGALALPGLISDADELQASRNRLGLLQGNDDAQTTALPNARRVPAAFSQARDAQDDTRESAEQLNRTWKNLFDQAQDLRVPVLALSDLTFQLGLSTENLGSQAGNTGRIIELVSKNISIAGTSSEQAQNGLRQFIQAMQRGKVEAEEFNSIGDSIPTVLQSVAKGLGITFTELRKEMLDGRLSAERFAEGLINDGARIDEQFRILPKRVSQAGTQFVNTFREMLDSTNRQNELTKNLVDLIDEARELLASPATSEFLSDAASDVTGLIGDIKNLIELAQNPSLSNLGKLLNVKAVPGGLADRLSGIGTRGAVPLPPSSIVPPKDAQAASEISQFFQSQLKPVANPTFFGEPSQFQAASPQTAVAESGPSVLALTNSALRASSGFETQQFGNQSVIRPKDLKDQTDEFRKTTRASEGVEKNTEQMIAEFRQLPSNLKSINEALLPAILAAGDKQAQAIQSLAGSLGGSSSGFDHLGSGGAVSFTTTYTNPLVRGAVSDRNALQNQLESLLDDRTIAENNLRIFDAQPTTSLTESQRSALEQDIANIDASIASLENEFLRLNAEIQDKTTGNRLDRRILTSIGSFATGGFGAIPSVGGAGIDSTTFVGRASPGEPYAFGQAAIDGIAKTLRGERSGGAQINDNRTINIQAQAGDFRATANNRSRALARLSRALNSAPVSVRG